MITQTLVLIPAFSGLMDSLVSGKWAPSGVPAIYKLLEQGYQPDSPFKVKVAVFARNAEENLNLGREGTRYIENLGNVTVIGWHTVGPRWLTRLVNELRQTVLCGLLARRCKGDVIYCTNGLVFQAAVLSRIVRRKVVLRMMGIFPFHRSVINGRGLVAHLYRWAYHSPFRYVVCTQEGSGAERILPLLLADSVPRSILLNGVNISNQRKTRESLRVSLRLRDAVVVLFLGRLTEYKGCDDFVDAAVRYLGATDRPETVFVLVGEGPRRKALQEKIQHAKLTDAIWMLGARPHGEVHEWFSVCDVYVSGNRHGNLSNANLEAMAMGCCLVMPKSDPVTGIDEATDALLPPAAAMRYDATLGDVALSEALLSLSRNPKKRKQMVENLKGAVSSQLLSWDARVLAEIQILSTVSKS